METLLAFAASLIALRLAGRVARRWRARRAPELLAWSAALFAYAVAAAALAWGAAHGWDSRAFRVYYLFGGLLTAPLLGAGSLLLWRRRWAGPVALVYVGLAIGIAVAVPLHGTFAGDAIPAAQDHLDFVPARLVAVLANSLGTAAVVVVARRDLPAAAARQRADRPGSGSGGRRERARRARGRETAAFAVSAVSCFTQVSLHQRADSLPNLHLTDS